MPATATEAPSTAVLTLLRSLGQIVLQPNAFTGTCLLLAWWLAEPRLACAALIGAVAANVSAILAGYCDEETRAGLHGFNGALAGLAAFHFIADPATAPAVAILAATGTAWLLEPCSRWLRARGLGFFSSPCLLVTWLWLPMVTVTSGPLAAAASNHAMNAARWSDGLFSGLAQTGFVSGALPGLVVLIGIAAASRRHALWALMGAGLASVAHLLLHACTSSFDAGLLGFNGALTALALADGGAVSTLGGIAISVALQATATYFGWPAMTAPFVLATWSMQWLRQRGTQDVVASNRASRVDAGRSTPASSQTGRAN